MKKLVISLDTIAFVVALIITCLFGWWGWSVIDDMEKERVAERQYIQDNITKPIDIEYLDDVVVITKTKEINTSIVGWSVTGDGTEISAKIKGVINVKEGGTVSIKNLSGKVWNFNIRSVIYYSRSDTTELTLKIDDHLKNQIKEI